jgi:hypothetical protein
MAPTRVRFRPGLSPGAGFPREHVFREFSEAPAEIRTTLEQPHFTYADLFRAGIPGGALFRGFLGAPAVIRHSLEQIPLRKILLLEEIPGTRISAIFRKFIVKTTFELKINTRRNPFNFESIQ